MSPSENSKVNAMITRNSDDETNNSFNLYAIDTKEKKVYITFFGAYKPKTSPEYTSIKMFSYL